MTLTNKNPPNPRRIVLLVEDSPDDAYFFERALRKSGIDCHFQHAMDGGIAVELLRRAVAGHSQMPGAIFLDLKMPVLNGFEVLEWLEEHAKVRTFPVIVLSGSDLEADRQRARALGASDYLVKPINMDKIVERLRGMKAFANHPSPAPI